MFEIVFLMKRKAIFESLVKNLKQNNRDLLIINCDFDEINSIIMKKFDILLLEVSETDEYNANYCIELAKIVKSHNSKCKVLLMCSEHDEESINLVLHAKKSSSIDDFVFYDVSIDYLASKLLTM